MKLFGIEIKKADKPVPAEVVNSFVPKGTTIYASTTDIPKKETSKEAQIADACADLRNEDMIKKMSDYLASQGLVVTPSGQTITKGVFRTVGDKVVAGKDAVVDTAVNTGYGIRGMFRKITDPVHDKIHELQDLGKAKR